MTRKELLVIRNEMQIHLIRRLAEVKGCDTEVAALEWVRLYAGQFGDWFDKTVQSPERRQDHV